MSALGLLLDAFPGSEILTEVEARQLMAERDHPGAYSAWRSWNRAVSPAPRIEDIPYKSQPRRVFREAQA